MGGCSVKSNPLWVVFTVPQKLTGKVVQMYVSQFSHALQNLTFGRVLVTRSISWNDIYVLLLVD